MTTLIVALSIVIGSIGICVVVWSIIDTRKKYFDDYLKRKNKK